MTTEMTETDRSVDERAGVRGTGSRGTRLLGAVVLLGIAVTAWLGFVASPADRTQGDLVRILYIHVPSVSVAYIGCLVTTVASGIWLWKRNEWWDIVASSSAEIAAVFTAITLVTGMVWGESTWGTWWEWDARLTSTLFLFLLLVGYQGLRGATPERDARGKRSAIVGLLLVPNVMVVNRSVEWWRSLHQDATINLASGDVSIEGLMLFTWMFALVVGIALYVWLMIHRFRVGWLADRVEDHLLDDAIAQRRAEGVPAGGAGGAPVVKGREFPPGDEPNDGGGTS